jgi:hypothetical protein
MNTTIRRLRKLENRFGPEIETDHKQLLLDRLSAMHLRLAAAQENGECRQPVELAQVQDALRAYFDGRRLRT